LKPSELKTILDQHRLWIESNRKQGTRADLQGAHLGGAHLGGADLRGANLESANLQDANLGGANLGGANLRGANLGGAYLESANLQDANLGGANLQGANLWDVDLQDATFTTNFKKAGWFDNATFSEDQIAWVCLHPKFHECAGSLKWVKVAADAA
jgi:uncharacterized protein YjbI with pentapeptide repeats